MGTAELQPWVVEYDKVALRGKPSVQSKLIELLARGDQFTGAETISLAKEDWVRLPRGTCIIKDKASDSEEDNPPVKMMEDAYVLISHPKYGTLVKKQDDVQVQERNEEGYLSKELMQQILAKSSNSKELVIPLEAKTWTKAEFELFVMSGGVVRPKWCSVPDMNDMVNNNMKEDEVELALRQASEWLAGADAVLVGSGAGMGVDSGLSTFRGGKAGVWPALEIVGLAYEEICDPKWFRKEPALAWAFWNFCHEAYQATKPHKGYDLVRSWAQKAPLGAFSFTSNIDSHWAASGWWKRRIIEVHGAVAWHQCSKGCCPDVWEAPTDLGLQESPVTHRVEGKLPTCPKCGEVARPCVQMFGGDSGFAKSRRAVQINRYDAWLKKLEARPDAKDLRMVCLELGCGLTVPTVRKELESVMGRFKNARLIRVNPENPGLSKDLQKVAVSLPLPAGEALSSLEPQVASILDAEKEMAHFVLWDYQGGGVEITAPVGSSCMQLVRLAETEDGVEVEFDGGGQCGFNVNNLVQLHLTQDLQMGDTVPRSFFWSLHKRSFDKDSHNEGSAEEPRQGSEETAEAEGEPLKTAVLKCWGMNFKNGMSQRLAARVSEISELLDSMNERFSTQAYQDEVRTKLDRRGVMQMVRSVQFELLPKYGLKPDESGVWLMQALTGLGMVGRSDVGAKAGLSMDLSYMNAAQNLPAILKPKEPEKPAPPPPEPIEVRLVQMAEENPATLKLDAMTDTQIWELREKVGQRVGVRETKMKQVKFLMKAGNSFATMKENECVRKEIFVAGLDRWVHPDEEPPYELEVSVKLAVEESEEVKLTLMSNLTIGQVKEALAAHVGRPEIAKKGKIVRRAGNSGFSAFEDTERLGGRKCLLLIGVEQLKADAQAAATAPRGAAGTPTPAKAQQPTPAKAQQATPAKAQPQAPPQMVLEDAIKLQKALIQGFQDKDFQAKLKDLHRALSTNEMNERKFNVERTKHFLSVQKLVLPNFGFRGDAKGVYDMMSTFGSNNFDSNAEFATNGLYLNQLLFSPWEVQEDWGSFRIEQPPKLMLVNAYSTDSKDTMIPVSLSIGSTVATLKQKLLVDWKVLDAHKFQYFKRVNNAYEELKDNDPLAENVYAHDPTKPYADGFLSGEFVPGQGAQSSGSSGGRPPPQRERWPPFQQLAEWIMWQQLGDQNVIGWMHMSFEGMATHEYAAWMTMPEESRWTFLRWVLVSPFFQRCRTEYKFWENHFVLPEQKASWRHAAEDPELRKVEFPPLLSRWFADDGRSPPPVPTPAASPSAAAPAAASEPMIVSVVRLGEDELVRWEVVLTRTSTIADLRQRLAEIMELDKKATKSMRFAWQRSQNFVSMVDTERVKKTMAVRDLPGDWPPPPDPAAANLVG